MIAAEALAEKDRIVALEVTQDPSLRIGPTVAHERDVAVFDLLEENLFALEGGPEGPYAITLSLRDHCLDFAISSKSDGGTRAIALPVRSFKTIIRDYFLLCDSYFQAIKGAPPSKIEAIDMARRGLHDEGADMLKDALAKNARVDAKTARRLFTLLCVLHIRRL